MRDRRQVCYKHFKFISIDLCLNAVFLSSMTVIICANEIMRQPAFIYIFICMLCQLHFSGLLQCRTASIWFQLPQEGVRVLPKLISVPHRNATIQRNQSKLVNLNGRNIKYLFVCLWTGFCQNGSSGFK